MIDGDDKQKTQGWVQGNVVRISGSTLSMEIPYLPPNFDHDLDRWSINIAEFETKTKEDYEWRKTWAKEGSSMDCEVDMHDFYKWEEGTIFDIALEEH